MHSNLVITLSDIGIIESIKTDSALPIVVAIIENDTSNSGNLTLGDMRYETQHDTSEYDHHFVKTVMSEIGIEDNDFSIHKKIDDTLNELNIPRNKLDEIKSLINLALGLQREACSQALDNVYNENEFTGSDVVWIELDDAKKAVSEAHFVFNL